MHITPGAPTMTIARVRELVNEMAAASTTVVCSFTREQLVDLLAEIDRRIQPASAAVVSAAPLPAPEVSAVTEYLRHRKNCERCGRRTSERCETGQLLYAAASAALMDQLRLLL